MAAGEGKGVRAMEVMASLTDIDMAMLADVRKALGQRIIYEANNRAAASDELQALAELVNSYAGLTF